MKSFMKSLLSIPLLALLALGFAQEDGAVISPQSIIVNPHPLV